MRALVPSMSQSGNVTFADVVEPSPQPNEALVAVSAFSVNRGETFLLEAPTPGWRPGKDVAGVVEVPAADGSGPAVGSRVVAHPSDSGWSERVAVPTDRIVSLPDAVTDEQAAALPLAGLTALRLARQAGSLIGKRILIDGASGGVGHYLTEIAISSGADVTAVVRTADRGSQLVALGATVATSLSDIPDRFDVAFESVGGKSFHETVRLVRPHGTMFWFGQASKEPGEARFFEALMEYPGVSIVHFSYSEFDNETESDLCTLVRLTERKLINPHIGLTAPWDHTNAIIDKLRGREVQGNAVLLVTRE
jgi:NADPH2:quinone reductase